MKHTTALVAAALLALLVGPIGAKDPGVGYSTIAPTFNNTFALGIQYGKGILIKNLVFTGRSTNTYVNIR